MSMNVWQVRVSIVDGSKSQGDKEEVKGFGKKAKGVEKGKIIKNNYYVTN